MSERIERARAAAVALGLAPRAELTPHALAAQGEYLHRRIVQAGKRLPGNQHNLRGRYNRVALRAWFRWQRRRAGL